MGKTTDIKNLLIEEYGLCFLGGKVSRKNPYTYHHLIPKRSGGQVTLQNGALLCNLQHSMFNAVENDNRRQAEELNDGFREFKRTKDLHLIKDMKRFVEHRITMMGYEIDTKGKIYTLRRR